MACVLHEVARSNVKQGACVVVLGDGAIGLNVCSSIGSPISECCLFGGNDERLPEYWLGAAETFNYHQLEGHSSCS